MARGEYFHVVAVRPGDRRKSVVNRTEDEVLAEFVIPFVSSGTIKARWGEKLQSYQVLELRVYRTRTAFDRTLGKSLDQFLGKAKNLFPKFEERAKKSLGVGAYRVFVVMPIQGEKFGSQDQQRIYREYDERFAAIEKTLSEFDCVAIRIDKEHPLEDIVGTIKQEIRKAQFLVADLTDERPSCYFEAGYGEARGKPIIYLASKESIINPGTKTSIHFDIHMNVHFFTNHKQLKENLREAIVKNKLRLLAPPEESSTGVK